MKKFLRFIVGLILAVVAGVLILGLIEPKTVLVTRTVLIKAPKEAVFEQIQYFKNWTNWSPWYRMNPTMKLTYSGTDGQAGSSYHWAGGDEKKTGEGDMRNLAIEATQMNYQVDFLKPFKSSAKGTLGVKDSAGGTKATWTCNVDMPFPFNAMFLVMNMDKTLGPDFDSGLNNMKLYMEGLTKASESTGINIKEVIFPEHTYAGMRKTIGWAEIGKFFIDNKGMAVKATGSYTGLYYTWDTTTMTTDAVAAYPVSDTTHLPAGISAIHIPAATAFVAVMNGGYSGEMKYHNALHQYIKAKGKKQLLVVEEYPSGPTNEPDSNKWITNIYYLAQ